MSAFPKDLRRDYHGKLRFPSGLRLVLGQIIPQASDAKAIRDASGAGSSMVGFFDACCFLHRCKEPLRHELQRNCWAMFALDVPFWGLMWGLCMATSLSSLLLFFLVRPSSHPVVHFQARRFSSGISSLSGPNRETFQLRWCFAGGLNDHPTSLPVFACPTSFSSTSPPFSFLCPFLASSFWSKVSLKAQTRFRAFQSKDLNGYAPVMQPKFKLCFAPFR